MKIVNSKTNSKNLILGDGDINSPIMLIGEAPGELEDSLGHSFQGEVGLLLKKCYWQSSLKLKSIFHIFS